MSDAEEVKRERKCLCGVMVDEDYDQVKCEACGGKKHPILCDDCRVGEYHKALEAAPFRIRAVLEMADTGPLGDEHHGTFPTCLRYDPDWYDHLSLESYQSNAMETQMLRIAVEMLKEGRGYTFTSLDRSIIMKALTKEKNRDNDKALLAEFFSLMKPYLGWMEADEHERAIEENDGDKKEDDKGDGEEDKAAAEPESKRAKH